MFRSLLIAAGFVFLGAAAVSAHITLENRQAAVGAAYKAVLQVPHGCSGSATKTVKIRIPAGVLEVKPMPKPGWKLDVVNGKYPKAFARGRAQVSEGVTEISWSGGNLPDAFYDEFVFAAAISDDLQAGQTIYFPVVQECEKGVARWIEIPAAGAPANHGAGAGDEQGEPAPGLRLLPKP